MTFFSAQTRWSNSEFIPFKLAVASFSILLGSYLHSFFEQYDMALWVIFAISYGWTLKLWLGKMKEDSGTNG